MNTMSFVLTSNLVKGYTNRSLQQESLAQGVALPDLDKKTNSQICQSTAILAAELAKLNEDLLKKNMSQLTRMTNKATPIVELVKFIQNLMN